MDEMTLLRELGKEIDTTTGEPAPRARHRVVAGIADGAGAGRESRRVRLLGMRRVAPVGAVLLAGGLAVSAGVAINGGGVVGTPPSAAQEGTTGQDGTTGQNGTTTQDGTTLDARSLLLAAAETARTSETTAPNPRAFLYTRTKERGVSGLIGSGPVVWQPYASTRESWLSVDGSRDGAVTPSGSTELVAIPAGESTPAFRGDLPSDAADMRKHLYRDAAGGELPADAIAFQAGMSLAQERLLPSATRAALFEAMSSIPDVTVVADAENVDGKHGVAVAIRDGSRRDELIFDKEDHRVIGTRSVNLVNEPGLPAGTVMYTSAVLESAVVDAVRLRPDGTKRPGAISGGVKEKAAADGKG